jgi:methylated-DNA-[protein]-cysteine S-methyltransferase
MPPIVWSGRMRAEETRYAVPGWGEGELWMRGGVVLVHEFAYLADAGANAESEGAHVDRRTHSAHPPWGDRDPPSGTVPTDSAQVGNGLVPTLQQLDATQLVDRFTAFFAGQEVQFDDVPLDLDGSTPFQLAVAETLRASVPRGEVVSYGELAALAGYPGAARAVGTFCAHNRFMLLVPCHRVVGADGLGGYGSAGLAVKRRLLALEGVGL